MGQSIQRIEKPFRSQILQISQDTQNSLTFEIHSLSYHVSKPPYHVPQQSTMFYYIYRLTTMDFQGKPSDLYPGRSETSEGQLFEHFQPFTNHVRFSLPYVIASDFHEIFLQPYDRFEDMQNEVSLVRNGWNSMKLFTQHT